MVKWIGDRISTEDNNNNTTIIIYPNKHKVKEFLLTFWVIGFSFVGLFMIYMLFSGIDYLEISSDDVEEIRDKQRIYAIVFIGFWIYFEYKTLKALLWYKFGKELIKIDDVALSIKKSTFSYGKANRYFFENIKKFTRIEKDDTSFSQFFDNAYWTEGTDVLTFEYFGKSKSFARRLDEKSANLLIRFIDDRIKKRLRKKH